MPIAVRSTILTSMLSTEKKWLDYSLPVMEGMRGELAATDAVVLAARTGTSFTGSNEGRGQFALEYLGQTYHVTYPQFEARDAQTGEEVWPELRFLFLHYFQKAEGTRPADRWIAYRELPDGMFYFHAFQGYTGARLVKAFQNDLARFKVAASLAGGEALSHGDGGFSFRPLPRVPMAVIYWLGDDEFPPNANVLFDPSAGHYLSTDGLAVLGRELCSKIIGQG
ncbi:MAG: DUF3786 domain-containing protein [Anaerolineae bacterium]|nr:DUF3786 domain-containing protein [Anaerolineae bacterium]